MSYFNKKEEVIDLQLTQHGKYLLSLGKMKPAYYSFFDDNILYDGQYGGVTESRNDIETRIQDETLYNKTQYIFSGRETELKKIIKQNKYNLELPETERLNIPNTTEKFYSLVSPIGTSDFDSNKAPSFNLTFLNGEISSSNSNLVGAFSTQKIPQIDLNFKFQIIVKDNSVEERISEEFRYTDSSILPDNTYLSIVDNSILLHAIEKNTEFEKENFDIEIFMVEQENVSGSIYTPGLDNEQATKREILIPLLFQTQPQQVINNIMVEDNVSFSNLEYSPSYVEYYFELLVDDDIPETEICSSISKFKSENKFVDEDFNCEERKDLLTRVNIYGSNITEQDIEQCGI
jgi:hypothetical protein